MQEKEQLKQSIANISHDLRTPLTSIQGYLVLLKKCENNEEQEHCFSIIQAKADDLTELLHIFYDLSLIDSEDYILEVEKLDINRIVTDCLIDKYSELKELTPIIKTENAPVWITANTVACKSIIENLITNAIRYSNDYIEIAIEANGIFAISVYFKLDHETHIIIKIICVKIDQFFLVYAPWARSSACKRMYKYTLQCIERRIVKWAMCKYKSFRGHRKRAEEWLSTVRKREPKLFAHWDRMYLYC